jgi:predicted AlkP superfamily pyrophosphatase or phosphodiesterase
LDKLINSVDSASSAKDLAAIESHNGKYLKSVNKAEEAYAKCIEQLKAKQLKKEAEE